MEKKLYKTIEELKKRNKELKKLAYTDNLTGCYNRNWLFEKFQPKDKWFLTMIDVNGLKRVNDTLGHTKGDEFLIDISDKLKLFGDVVRYGGDEFIILTQSENKFEKLNSLNDLNFSTGGVYFDEKETIKEAIIRADKKLYINKRKKD